MNFGDALKMIHDPESYKATPLLNADGSTLLTNKYACGGKRLSHNSKINKHEDIIDNKTKYTRMLIRKI